MESEPPKVEPRIYLGHLGILLVEHNPQEREIVAQVLTGFKVKSIARRSTASEALNYMRNERTDLVIVGAALQEVDGFELTRSIRKERTLAGSDVPLILLTGHTRAEDVKRARDCGASWVIAKPIQSLVLFQRIAWLAKDTRLFIDTEAYTGPDRRFKAVGPPPGTSGRRKDDLSLTVGEATTDNMSQLEIDALMKSRGVAR